MTGDVRWEIGEVAFGAAAMWLSINEAIGLHRHNRFPFLDCLDNTHIFLLVLHLIIIAINPNTVESMFGLSVM